MFKYHGRNKWRQRLVTDQPEAQISFRYIHNIPLKAHRSLFKGKRLKMRKCRLLWFAVLLVLNGGNSALTLNYSILILLHVPTETESNNKFCVIDDPLFLNSNRNSEFENDAKKVLDFVTDSCNEIIEKAAESNDLLSPSEQMITLNDLVVDIEDKFDSIDVVISLKHINSKSMRHFLPCNKVVNEETINSTVKLYEETFQDIFNMAKQGIIAKSGNLTNTRPNQNSMFRKSHKFPQNKMLELFRDLKTETVKNLEKFRGRAIKH